MMVEKVIEGGSRTATTAEKEKKILDAVSSTV